VGNDSSYDIDQGLVYQPEKPARLEKTTAPSETILDMVSGDGGGWVSVESNDHGGVEQSEVRIEVLLVCDTHPGTEIHDDFVKTKRVEPRVMVFLLNKKLSSSSNSICYHNYVHDRRKVSSIGQRTGCG